MMGCSTKGVTMFLVKNLVFGLMLVFISLFTSQAGAAYKIFDASEMKEVGIDCGGFKRQGRFWSPEISDAQTYNIVSKIINLIVHAKNIDLSDSKIQIFGFIENDKNILHVNFFNGKGSNKNFLKPLACKEMCINVKYHPVEDLILSVGGVYE